MNEDFEIIDNTEDGKDNFGHCYGSETYKITEDQIEALKNGKCLATTINGGEYSIFVAMEPDQLKKERKDND